MEGGPTVHRKAKLFTRIDGAVGNYIRRAFADGVKGEEEGERRKEKRPPDLFNVVVEKMPFR